MEAADSSSSNEDDEDDVGGARSLGEATPGDASGQDGDGEIFFFFLPEEGSVDDLFEADLSALHCCAVEEEDDDDDDDGGGGGDSLRCSRS